MKPLTTPVLQARDIILGILRHRLNLTLTETVARDAANNAAQALMDLLAPIPSDEPPPVREVHNGFCLHCRAAYISAPDSPTLGSCPICGRPEWQDSPEVKAIK